MKLGVMHGDILGPQPLSAVLDMARRTEAAGLDTFWLPSVFGHDPLTVLAVLATEVRRIELGTNIVHIYPRHPVALAEAAMTVQVASGGRLVLGIGTSGPQAAARWGKDFRPVPYMREYLSALIPLLRGDAVDVSGTELVCAGRLRHPELVAVPVLVAALGPQNLALAGRLSDGTTTWMTGPDTLARQVVPPIREAAADAERPPPRMVVGVPVLVTDAPQEGRTLAIEKFASYAAGAPYLRMLAHEGWAQPGDAAIVGDEATVTAELDRYANAGATDLAVVLFGSDGDIERTLAHVASNHHTAQP